MISVIGDLNKLEHYEFECVTDFERFALRKLKENQNWIDDWQSDWPEQVHIFTADHLADFLFEYEGLLVTGL